MDEDDGVWTIELPDITGWKVEYSVGDGDLAPHRRGSYAVWVEGVSQAIQSEGLSKTYERIKEVEGKDHDKGTRKDRSGHRTYWKGNPVRVTMSTTAKLSDVDHIGVCTWVDGDKTIKLDLVLGWDDVHAMLSLVRHAAVIKTAGGKPVAAEAMVKLCAFEASIKSEASRLPTSIQSREYEFHLS